MLHLKEEHLSSITSLDLLLNVQRDNSLHQSEAIVDHKPEPENKQLSALEFTI